MLKTNYPIMHLNLQLFAEGAGDGGTGAEGAKGVTASVTSMQKGETNPLADVIYGKQQETAQTASAEEKTAPEQSRDLKAEFESYIKGDYRDIYNEKVQNIVQNRLKNTKETVDKYNALSPVLETLAKKHGVDPTDIEALQKAIDEDDYYFQEEALEKGVTIDELKRIRKIERENADLKKQMQEQATKENASKLYASWMQQAEQLKAVYPSFNLEAEMQNPKFVDLLRVPSIDVRTAFEVLHKDEILPAAMQYTAKTVEQKLTNKIRANGARPAENGMNSQSAAVVKSDVSQLSKADRQEVLRRVARGEKISFG